MWHTNVALHIPDGPQLAVGPHSGGMGERSISYHALPGPAGSPCLPAGRVVLHPVSLDQLLHPPAASGHRH